MGAVPIVLGAAAGAGVAIGYATTTVLVGAAIGAVVGGITGALVDELRPDRPPNPVGSIAASTRRVQSARTGLTEPIFATYGNDKTGTIQVFKGTQATTNEYTYTSNVIGEGPISAVNRIWIDGVLTTDDRFDGLLTVEINLGADNRAASTLLQEAAGWTTAHRQRRVATVDLKMKRTAQNDPFTGPLVVEVEFDGKLVKPSNTAGSVEYLSETGLVYSTNFADCILDMMRSPFHGRGLVNNKIRFTTFAEGRTKRNISVTFADGTTGPALTCNGTVDTGQRINDNITDLMHNGAMDMSYVNGKYELITRDVANTAASTPTIAFNVTEDHIIDGIKLADNGTRNLYNQVIVTHVDPTNDWQPSQVISPEPEGTVDRGLLATDGRRLSEDFSFNFIKNKNQAANRARIILEESRNRKHIEITATSELQNVKPGNIITVSYADLGMVRAQFEVKKSTRNGADRTFKITASEYKKATYVFSDSNVMFSGTSQRSYIDNAVTTLHYAWNGTRFVATNNPAPTSSTQTLPVTTSFIQPGADLTITSIDAGRIFDVPEYQAIAYTFNYVTTQKLRNSYPFIELLKLNFETGIYEWTRTSQALIPSFGNTMRFGPYDASLDGLQHTYRLRARFGNNVVEGPPINIMVPASENTEEEDE